MRNYQQEMFALQDANGNLIGLDIDSGGYPWVPETLAGVWLCTESKSMEEYATKTFTKQFKLVRIKVSVERIGE